MKILIVSSLTLFESTQLDQQALQLQAALIQRGHEVEILRIPVQLNATQFSSQLLMLRSFELYHVDQVIALQFPTYLVRHPEKRICILEHYSDAGLEENSAQFNLLKKVDQEVLHECEKVYVHASETLNYLLQQGIQASLLPSVNAEVDWDAAIEVLLS